MSVDLIVALDVPDTRAATAAAAQLGQDINYYKIGLELFTAAGPDIVRAVAAGGRRIFLDLKLHDIPRTVERAVAAAAGLGVDLLTVHAAGGREMIAAAARAARAAGAHRPRIVAVTTLTSLNQQDLADIGVARPLAEHTLALGRLAIESGADGLVCSPLEARAFRHSLGAAPILVTPGIRPAGADLGDQKRVATPADAVAAGASCLVVGRPILEAPDPAAAARAVRAEIARAAATRP